MRECVRTCACARVCACVCARVRRSMFDMGRGSARQTSVVRNRIWVWETVQMGEDGGEGG